MKASIPNAVVKRVNKSKNGDRFYLTIGDKDEIKEVDISCSVCGVDEGYQGEVAFDGFEARSYQNRVSFSCNTVRAVEPVKK